MNIFYLALWHLMVVVVVGEHHAFGNISSDKSENELRYKRMITIKPLTLKVRIKGKVKVINLEPTNQLLANEHLPVIYGPYVRGGKNFNLKDLQHDLGHFTMYHDYVTKSAVVYYHKRRELDGVVDISHKIEGISVDRLDQVHPVAAGFFRSTNLWKFFKRIIPSRNSRLSIQKCDRDRPKVYPELLIVISEDMMIKIEKESDSLYLVKTISHVITVYNIVDMLFKFVKAADISLNIAAIYIEGMPNDLGFELGTRENRYVDGDNVNHLVRTFFLDKRDIFRPHSYDYVVYHTRFPIEKKNGGEGLGVSMPGNFESSLKPGNKIHPLTMTVRDYDSYKHYTTIAHELSHIFGVEHDTSGTWFFQHPCEKSIMAACTSDICLRWSDRTEEEFKKFFRSEARCILENEPQSLHPQKPRIIWTSLQQCRCHGYKSFTRQVKSTECSTSVSCSDERGYRAVTYLPPPMDGTPCGRYPHKTVCWNEKCVPRED